MLKLASIIFKTPNIKFITNSTKSLILILSLWLRPVKVQRTRCELCECKNRGKRPEGDFEYLYSLITHVGVGYCADGWHETEAKQIEEVHGRRSVLRERLAALREQFERVQSDVAVEEAKDGAVEQLGHHHEPNAAFGAFDFEQELYLAWLEI